MPSFITLCLVINKCAVYLGKWSFSSLKRHCKYKEAETLPISKTSSRDRFQVTNVFQPIKLSNSSLAQDPVGHNIAVVSIAHVIVPGWERCVFSPQPLAEIAAIPILPCLTILPSIHQSFEDIFHDTRLDFKHSSWLFFPKLVFATDY